MAKQVLIYTLSWDRLEYTKRCIRAIRKKTKYPYRHLILDQGSKDGTKDWLMLQPDILITIRDTNIGISAAMNHIHTLYSNYDYYVKLDNDAEVLTDGWLTKMVNAQEDPRKHREMILSPYVKGLVAHKGGVGRGIPDNHPQAFDKYNVRYAPNLGGICLMYNNRIWEDFGGYPDNRPKHYANDFELTGKWQELNFYNGYVEDIFVLHMDGTLGQQKKYPEYFDRPDHTGKLNPEDYKDYVRDF